MNTPLKIPTGLYVLPFDHQGSLYKLFGWQIPLSTEQEIFMRKTRMITYEGYLKALHMGMNKLETAILTDDTYGNEVLERAYAEQTPIIYTLEKNGQETLVFAHDNWQEIIYEKKPTWVKTLVRYNPTSNPDNLRIIREKLKQVSDFTRENEFGFMIEPLVIPTEQQSVIDDFDHTCRPELTIRMLTELYEYGIYPTIWKIEGSDESSFYTSVSATIKNYDTSARIVILGRNETMETVKTWLSVGAAEPLVIGFAVGRTVFAQALYNFMSGKITDKEAIDSIANNYYELYTTFNQAKHE